MTPEQVNQIREALERGKWLEADLLKKLVVTSYLGAAVDAAESRVDKFTKAIALLDAAPKSEPVEIEAWRKAASDAAASLETISKLAGRDELLTALADIRAYAWSRASAAREGIDAAIAAAKEKS